MNERKKENSKKLTLILVVIGIIVLALTITIVVVVFSLAKSGDNTPTQYVLSTPQTEAELPETSWTFPDMQASEFVDVSSGEEVTSDVVSEIPTETQSEYVGPLPTEQVDVSAGSGEELFSELDSKQKNGDNVLSDSPDNEFISLISSKYKVSPELLVAIYSVPDTGTNFVLQFKNERDANGNVVKSPDTLEKVYNIGKDRSVKIATGKMMGNVGVSYAESLLCFGIVTESVMCQYPDYFTGVEDKRPNH